MEIDKMHMNSAICVFVLFILFLNIRNTWGDFSYQQSIPNKYEHNTVQSKKRSIRSIDTKYCEEVTDKGLTWPQTKLGKVIYSQEFCFDSGGNRVRRVCSYAATWSRFQNCTVVEKSFLSDKLIEIYEHKWTNISTIKEITSRKNDLNALDIHLTLDILSLFEIPHRCEQILEIIDNIMEINSSILQESETTMKTISNLKFLGKKCFQNMSVPECHKNFDYLPFICTGDDIFSKNKNCKMTKKSPKNTTITETVVQIVTKNCFSQKMSMIFHKNDGFFPSSENVTNIIEVNSGYLVSFSMSLPRQIQNGVACVSWNKYSQIWENTGVLKITKKFLECRYGQFANDGIFGVRTTFKNVPTNSEFSTISKNQNGTYCERISEGGLTWPQTKAGDWTFSEEFCFFSKMYRVRRSCSYAATWLRFERRCNIVEKSVLSDRLIEVYDRRWYDYSLSLLEEITSKSSNISALDVYLASEILVAANESYCGEKLHIIDNLLGIDSVVLEESETKMKRISYLRRLADTCFGSPSLSDKNQRNFLYKSFFCSGNDVFVVTKNEITQIFEGFPNNNETIIQVNTSNCDMKNMGLVFFKNDNFFKTGDNITKIVKIVSSMYIVSLTFWIPHPNESVDCVSWNRFSQNWENTGVVNIIHRFVSCSYAKWAQDGIFGLRTIPPRTVTSIITEIFESNVSVEEKFEKIANTSNDYEQFSASDVSLVGDFLQNISQSSRVNLDLLTSTVNNIQNIDADVLSRSQVKQHSTDKILSSIDNIIKNYDNATVSVKSNFSIMVHDLKNFSGFVITNQNELEILERSVILADLLSDKTITSAVLVKSSSNNEVDIETKIRTTIFLNDKLFIEKNASDDRSLSTIFGVLLPELRNFPMPLSVIYKLTSLKYPTKCQKNNHWDYTYNCVYWHYNNSKNHPGFWQKDHKAQIHSDFAVCDYYHATHFGLLLQSEDKYCTQDLLHYITIINIFISLVGLFIIILTAIIFVQWRQELGNKISLHFVCASILQLSSFYISSSTEETLPCLIIGVILHYSTLAQFSWMLVISVLQFRRFVMVLTHRPRHLLLKTSLFAWGFPLLIVTLILILDRDSYVSRRTELCYPSGYSLYLGVWLPIVIILSFNFIVFSAIVRNIYIVEELRSNINNYNSKILQWKLSLILFFMLGLTWIFGFLGEFSVVFEFLFSIFATLQGFVTFLFCVVLNRNVRNMYLGKSKIYFLNGTNETNTSV